MRFEWDPAKSSRNLRDRALPFELAMALFDGPTIEVDGRRREYGERRIIAIGIVRGRVMVCVYTWRGPDDDPVRRIISLRRADRSETDAYHNAFPQRTGSHESRLDED